MNATQAIHVTYFASLREARGAAEEALAIGERTTARELYDRLSREHHFKLTAAQVRVAVNDAFASWDRALEIGDRVAFIPPVAGG